MTSVTAPRFLERLERAAFAAGYGSDWVAVARKAGVSDRTLRRWREGKHDDPKLSTLEAVAKVLRTSVAALLGEGAAEVVRETQAGYGDPFNAPLLCRSVAAGRPRLEVIAEGLRPYYFRREWMARKGWNGDRDDERFGVYRLGEKDIADSMFPTIQPGSVLLVDRGHDRSSIPARSIWIVRVPLDQCDEPQLPLLEDAATSCLTTKRVTMVDHQLVLESDNPAPIHAPKLVRCRPQDRASILEGRVIWYATEVS